jgi:predicted DNA-binding transcriptional regulator AlpA
MSTATPAGAAPETYLSWPQARPHFGNISRSTAWREVRAGRLPAPHRISAGRKAWALSDVHAWQAARKPQSQLEKA